MLTRGILYKYVNLYVLVWVFKQWREVAVVLIHRVFGPDEDIDIVGIERRN